MVLRLEVKKNQNFDGHTSTEILTVVVVQKCKSTKSWTLQVIFNQNLPFITPPPPTFGLKTKCTCIFQKKTNCIITCMYYCM